MKNSFKAKILVIALFLLMPCYMHATENELSVGGGYMFYTEFSTLDGTDYNSLLHGLSANFSWRLYEDKYSLFGFAYNLDFGIPFNLYVEYDNVKASMIFTNCKIGGFTTDNAFGLQFRYPFCYEHRLECFAGAKIGTTFMAYNVGFGDDASRKYTYNVNFGIQARLSYIYIFNDFIGISAGSIFEYDFFSLAQIVDSSACTRFHVFRASPIVTAVMKF